jgi:pimeloyl-ACP methyl ester carboxylesterase
MESYDHDGLHFEVSDSGPRDGPTVIALHGFPETRRSWDRVTPLLADAGYRVLAPDQRGYSPGARPHGRRAYRLEHLAADVVNLADQAGAERFHVIGHDWGGAVAWSLAAWHPERLHTMTSLATPHPRAFLRSMVTSSQLLHSWYMAFFQLPALPELSFREPGLRRLRQTLLRSGLDEAAMDGYLEVLGQPGAATGAINWYRAIPFTPPAKLGPSPVPTLYVYGDHDFALGQRAADLTGRFVTGPYRYEILRGAGHWLPEAHASIVAQMFLTLVASNGRGEPPLVSEPDPATGHDGAA